MEKSREATSNATMSSAQHLMRAKEILKDRGIRFPFGRALIHLNKAVSGVAKEDSRKNARIRVAKLCENSEHYKHRSGPAMFAGLNYSGAAALAENLGEKRELYLNAARNFDLAMRTSPSRQVKAAGESIRAYELARSISTDTNEIERLSNTIGLRKTTALALKTLAEVNSKDHWPAGLKLFISETAGRLTSGSSCSTTELADELNVPEESVEKLAKLSEVALSDMRGRWTRRLTPERKATLSKLKSLVRKGLPQCEIGMKMEKDRKALHMFLRYNGLLEEWKANNAIYEARIKEKKRLEKKRARLERLRPFRIVPTDGWAERKAKRYMMQNRVHLPPAEMHKRLLTIFREYKSAKESGTSGSLEQLGAPLRLFPASVAHILRKARLPYLTPRLWVAKPKNAL